MTIHAKNCKPNYKTFCFNIFLLSEGMPPPSDAPEGGRVSFLFGIGRGVSYDYSCKKC